MTARHTEVLTAVQTAIRGLGLTGLNSSSVIYRKLAFIEAAANAGISFPICLLSPKPERLSGGGVTTADDVEYGVNVAFVAKDNQETTLVAGSDNIWTYRERCRRAFHNRRLSGITDCLTCTFEPGEIVSPGAWFDNYLATVFTIWVKVRESRGLTART